MQINLMWKFTTGQALITVMPRHNQQENKLHQVQTLLRDKIIYAWDILEIKTDLESVFINEVPEPQQPPRHHETDTRDNLKIVFRLSAFYIYTTNEWNIPLIQEPDFSQLSLSLSPSGAIWTHAAVFLHNFFESPSDYFNKLLPRSRDPYMKDCSAALSGVGHVFFFVFLWKPVWSIGWDSAGVAK